MKEAIIEAIKENPTDIDLKLVYADLLDEEGDLLGEYTRIKIELISLVENVEENRERIELLLKRAAEIGKEIGWTVVYEHRNDVMLDWETIRNYRENRDAKERGDTQEETSQTTD